MNIFKNLKIIIFLIIIILIIMLVIIGAIKLKKQEYPIDINEVGISEESDTNGDNNSSNDMVNITINEEDIFYNDEKNVDVENEGIAEQGGRFTKSKISSYGMLKYYLMDYKDRVKYDVKEAYSLLSEEYKQSFGSYENYVKYVENNLEDIQSITIENYEVESNVGSYKNIYSFTDKNNNIYTIKEEAIMKYTIDVEKNEE